MNTNTETNYFKTSSLTLASYLLTKGANFIKAEETNPGHFEFIFTDPQFCEVLSRQFANGSTAPAQTLFEKRNFLMSQMRTV